MAGFREPCFELGPFVLVQGAFRQLDAPECGLFHLLVRDGRGGGTIRHGALLISFIKLAIARATCFFTALTDMPKVSAILSCPRFSSR